MRNIKIVIGANFGDEGKGLMTDYFCHQAEQRNENCIVVLHNGGAQRGHTVTTPTGIKHVFHHFGSGTFCEADTYCSKDFILNPMIFSQEFEELKALGYEPKVYIHPLCKISTPFDMILNQIIEEHRSGNRHGSCGMGIYETYLRKKLGKHTLLFNELYLLDDEEIKNRLYLMRDEWLPLRLDYEGIKFIPSGWGDIISNSSLITHYIEDLRLLQNNSCKTNDTILTYYKNIVFESGQGLLLDKNNIEYYPHLTPSNTGINNPLEVITKSFPNKSDMKIESCYVTRTYLTRHGAGRLDGECHKTEINPNIEDLTNIPNPHQGTLRYAKLDEESLEKRILNDFKPVRKYGATLSLAVTHENEYNYVFSDKFERKFNSIYFSDRQDREGIRRNKKISKCPHEEE